MASSLTMRNCFKVGDASRVGPKNRNSRVARYIALYFEGLSISAIADQFAVSKAAVSKALKYYGLTKGAESLTQDWVVRSEECTLITKWGTVLIDREDLPIVSGGTVTICPGSSVNIRFKDGRRSSLARAILNPPIGKNVDHQNHNILDNRRSNLRICSVRENVNNRRKFAGTISKYKGVIQKTKGWHARCISGGILYTAGPFPTEIDAALAYDDFAKRLHGEFACLNLS